MREREKDMSRGEKEIERFTKYSKSKSAKLWKRYRTYKTIKLEAQKSRMKAEHKRVH